MVVDYFSDPANRPDFIAVPSLGPVPFADMGVGFFGAYRRLVGFEIGQDAFSLYRSPQMEDRGPCRAAP
jgi:hypothetical protein